MEEDEQGSAQRRLITIVSDNVARLKRIVDDVMEVAPGAQAPHGAIDGSAEVARICAEWARVNGLVLGMDSRLRVQLPTEPLGVGFDAEHLRRVLVNLLDNGMRHATSASGALLVTLEPAAEQRVRLSVASDGEVIGRDVEPFLFEPFYSTRSRGAGLGLYICRELCGRYGAGIDYERHSADARYRNVFHVLMRRADVAAQDRLHL